MFMVFMLLGFAALCVMFFFVLRSIDELSRTVKADSARNAALLAEIDARLRESMRLQGVTIPEAQPEAASEGILDLGFAAVERNRSGRTAASTLPELKLGE